MYQHVQPNFLLAAQHQIVENKSNNFPKQYSSVQDYGCYWISWFWFFNSFLTNFDWHIWFFRALSVISVLLAFHWLLLSFSILWVLKCDHWSNGTKFSSPGFKQGNIVPRMWRTEYTITTLIWRRRVSGSQELLIFGLNSLTISKY